ncbi:hypothetical protein [Rhodococcus pyridinivorans]|uniref:hypothetical protein n=1 Tax=Rhodococcus pyridinivorans TaxID=103816 RepID=UPI00158638A7|nr:hypothetical protein [Rhodococcus pyridinivorans]WAL49597.1 hypothetical protein OQN32_27730 [Rhodococcus pyridinivorans]
MPPLNANLAGRVFPPTTYLVARAVRATNPLHHDIEASRAAGFADVIARRRSPPSSSPPR